MDELIRRSHSFLEEDDEIYYLGEYTTGAGHAHSQTNQLILNYKKPIDRKGLPDWDYKKGAILKAAQWFYFAISHTAYLANRARDATFIPIPPSAAKNSPQYDDRNHQLLQMILPQGDVRELILQRETREPLHTAKNAPRKPSDLLKNYFLNDRLLSPKPKELWLFDDLLTKGTHYRAAHNLLKATFPDVPVVGFFIARAMTTSPLLTRTSDHKLLP